MSTRSGETVEMMRSVIVVLPDPVPPQIPMIRHFTKQIPQQYF
jgi:hypothetical protein